MNGELKAFISRFAAVIIVFVAGWFLLLAMYNWWAGDLSTKYRAAYFSRGDTFFVSGVLLLTALASAVVVKTRKSRNETTMGRAQPLSSSVVTFRVKRELHL